MFGSLFYTSRFYSSRYWIATGAGHPYEDRQIYTADLLCNPSPSYDGNANAAPAAALAANPAPAKDLNIA